MAPVIRECQKRQIEYFIIHSNQHYSEEMDNIFFKELNLPSPHYNLGVGSGLHSNQTGNILIKMEPILLQENPDVVLVQGDTNTVLAGALAASKLDIKVGHIEAGLRSYDRTMPEETNRILTDHMSNYLFAVGPNQEKILKDENIKPNCIYTVGNTISDSLFQHIKIAEQKSDILQSLSLQPKGYYLVTAHRASNVDNSANLLELLDLFEQLHTKFKQKIVWPIHPRTQSKLKDFGITVPDYLALIPPVGYLDFIKLQQNAEIILTDSGGIQEEACLLGIPCITLRENTERPESVEVGANILVGRDADKAITAVDHWLSVSDLKWENPFGNGDVAEKIIDVVLGDTQSDNENIIGNEHSITVIGMGYMGLPIASLLANAGYSVTGIDLNQEKVAQINTGNCPFEEAGLPELVKKVVSQGFLSASTSVIASDTYLIAVPTPHNDSCCDLTYLRQAIKSIAKVAVDGQTVIIESTISPGTSLAMEQLFLDLGLSIHIVHCPERAIPGQTLFELVNNDRIIGAKDENIQLKVKRIYQGFVKGEIFLTDLTTAECIKLVENTSRDVGIAFANELAEISAELGVNVYDVIRLANRHPRVNVLTPGPGVGGHCIPIDPWFLVENTQSGDFVRLARSINDQRPVTIANNAITMLNELSVKGNRVGLLGVAYKANVDDCRETPADAILSTLLSHNVEVKYHDPFVPSWDCQKAESIDSLDDWADVMILVTDHTCYDRLNIKSKLLNTRG